MILEPKTNKQTAAVSFDNADSILAKDKSWKGDVSLTKSDLYLFMTRPSTDRSRFLSTLTIVASVTTNAVEQKAS